MTISESFSFFDFSDTSPLHRNLMNTLDVNLVSLCMWLFSAHLPEPLGLGDSMKDHFAVSLLSGNCSISNYSSMIAA